MIKQAFVYAKGTCYKQEIDKIKINNLRT